MNEIINKFLLAGDQFMPEMHLDILVNLVNLDLHIVLVEHLLKRKKGYKNTKKQEIQDTFIKTNEIKCVFKTIWF